MAKRSTKTNTKPADVAPGKKAEEMTDEEKQAAAKAAVKAAKEKKKPETAAEKEAREAAEKEAKEKAEKKKAEREAKEEEKRQKREQAAAEKAAMEIRQADFMKQARQDVKSAAARLTQAGKADDKAADHRLSAALTLAGVKAGWVANKMAKSHGAFKDFCIDNGVVSVPEVDSEGNVITPAIRGRSWENVRKLIAVGEADNPEEAMQAMRDGTRAAVAKHRQITKKKKDETPPADDAGGTHGNAPTYEDMKAMAGALPESEQAELAADLRSMAGDSMNVTIDQMKEDFAKMSDDDKFSFAQWVCDELNLTISV